MRYRLADAYDRDKLTGLLGRRSFCRAVDDALAQDTRGAAEGGYAVISFDVVRFKVINELFGTRRGDKLLQHIASVLAQSLGEGEYACRVDADHFAVFMRNAAGAPQALLSRLSEAIAAYDLPFEIAFNAGVYVTCAETMPASAMMDRAGMALSSIKGSYTVRYRYYEESLRSEMLSEHEIESMTSAALRGRQFVVYYQPQYSHSTGMLVGAEALVRWQHPERGMILPGVFIPIFERNGFITELDLYVFEHACMLLARCMREKIHLIPVATNFSRYDVFQPDFIEKLEAIRERYGVPAKYLHIELTETVFIGGSKRMNAVIGEMHARGYTVQMDDFGSGYSSLNVLKDTDVDCFKLDMEFLSDGMQSGKGGTILGTVVRMAKWLGVRVIAEGVETQEQADFLRSIGCDCMQGYLFSRPLPEKDYMDMLYANNRCMVRDDCGASAAAGLCDVPEEEGAVFYWEKLERALENERRFKIASEQVNIYYWEYNVATREMRPCFRCMRDLGLPPVMTNYPESAFEMGVFPPEVHDLYRSWHRQVAAGVPELEAIMPLTAQRIPFRVRYTTEFDEYGRPVKAYGSAALVKDAAARPAELEQMDKSNRRALQLVAQHSDRVVLLYDLKTHTVRFSDEMADQYGMNNSTIESLFDAGRIMPESAESARRILRNIEKGVPYGRENIRFKYRENYYCWLDFKYTTLFDEEKRPTGAFLSYVDITDKVEALERSRHDGMTGLYNRATAEELIAGRVEKGSRPGILLLMDMDGLKEINDTYGHQEGDRAILSVAAMIRSHFRTSDVVGRFGGDEFAVYLDGAADSSAAIAASVESLLQKAAGIAVGAQGERSIRLSVGAARQEARGDSFEALYHRADAALYHAKRHGKNRLAFYEPEMEEN